jgi:RNA polymerase sigma-32 factor
MRAVQKFDPEKGIKFSYYAAFWIKAYILKFIMDNWRMVKVGTTQAQRKLFYNLNKERQRLQAQGFDPDMKTLSERLDVTEEEIIEMDQRLSRKDQSLNATLGEDGTTTHMDFLPALGPGVEETITQDEVSGILREHLESIMQSLNEKERDILQQRLLTDSPMTLREIGEKYGITRERVRQIESRLLQKIKDHLADKIDDFSPDWIPPND